MIWTTSSLFFCVYEWLNFNSDKSRLNIIPVDFLSDVLNQQRFFHVGGRVARCLLIQ